MLFYTKLCVSVILKINIMRKSVIFLLLLLCAGSIHAAKEPKAVANARKAVISLLIYSDGNLLRSGTGVFVGENGDILSSYSLFVGADSAVAIDPTGRVRGIKRIVGADDIYDCIKVRVDWDKKIFSIPMAATEAAAGNILYLVSYGTKKSGPIETLPVAAVDKISGNPYYTFTFPMQERFLSAPVVNEQGELVALMQSSAENDTINSYGVAASLACNLQMGVLEYSSSKFKNIDIPCALPAAQKDALTLLYLIQGKAYSSDEKEKRDFNILLNDYISEYPDSYEGYILRVNSSLNDADFLEKAQKDWARALAVSDKPDDVHYNISMTYRTAVYELAKDSAEAKAYTDSTLLHIDKAIAIKPEPLYKQFKGQQLYETGNYAAAFECYASLSSTSMRSADNFAYAAKCKEALGKYDAAIAYMDSAIATYGSLPVAAMAPFVIERATMKHRQGRSREAVLDYNLYEQLASGNLNAHFYFIREQAEYDAKMFRQALDDIETAIRMSPNDYGFLIEKGRLCYRVKMVDEAIAALEAARLLAPENPDVYYILGRCHAVKGDTVKAKEFMLKAKEYGHYDAEKQLEAL